jgi:hypothetical protein
MTLNDYERNGGFSDELHDVRTIGQTITTLEEKIMARPSRLTDRHAIQDLKAALETVRDAIVRTRQETL